MSFPCIDGEVLYFFIYIYLHIVNDMDKGHYFCDVLDYNTGTWCNFDDVTITKYSGYPKSVYDNLSIDKKQKKGKCYSGWIRQDCVNVIY